MKILIAGDWHSELHEEAVYRALQQLGHRPVKFSWHQYFKPSGGLRPLLRPLFKAQNKYMLGPTVRRLNHDLVASATREQPDVIFVYRGTHIYLQTLRRLRQAVPGVMLVGYNNDDPFSPLYPRWQWRYFLAGIPEYDLVLAYRWHNLEDFREAGAKHVDLLRSWFVPEKHHPVKLTASEQKHFGCDVMFAGHYEDDGRVSCIEEIVRQGWSLRLYGHEYGWKTILGSDVLRRYYPTRTVWGADYNKALNGAKVALCFFSKLNRDTYTRRCFEIPASGTLMLSEYSDDLAGVFEEGVEADFFRNRKELVEKLAMYLENDELRERVARAGMEKVHSAGHDVKSRMEWLISTYFRERLLNEAE